MKVAVISQQNSGKSCFIALLAGLFSRSQNKNVAIFNTGSTLENQAIVQTKDAGKLLRSVHVYRALLDTDAIQTGELFDYGIRQGQENVFIFDILSSSMEQSEKEELLLTSIDKIPSDLSLVEIQGDVNSELNSTVINACDVILYLFTYNVKSLESVKMYNSMSDPKWRRKTGYICSLYDRNAVGEEKLGKIIGVNKRNIMLYPYCSVIQKEAVDGTLDSIVYYIMKGQHEVIELRPKLLEVMQYLYDIPGKVRYIREVSEWFS